MKVRGFDTGGRLPGPGEEGGEDLVAPPQKSHRMPERISQPAA